MRVVRERGPLTSDEKGGRAVSQVARRINRIMCGLAGFLAPGPVNEASHLAAVMAERLVHRGPDDAGVWADPGSGVALAFRRLAIIDLSPAGHQPMVSHCGRYVIIFNGEIYNHLELRADLDRAGVGTPWRGHSDTETLLAALARWGVRRTLQRCGGMFAFALWDQEERQLVLARDRTGEKPLYYGWQNGTLVFGSELKALRAHPSFKAE